MLHKNETQATGLQLSKNSTPEVIKTYFQKVLELKQSGKDFPIDLDEVWPVVYSYKKNAVETLEKEFVENEDYITQDVDYQFLPQKGKNLSSGRPSKKYYLSVPCLEYFIAKRVKPVFEVYRKVFHKTVEHMQAARQISQHGSPLPENTIITVKMGEATNQIYITGGVVYAKFSPVMRYLGYASSGSGSQYIKRIGAHHFKQLQCGVQQAWFININGFNELLKMSKISIQSSAISSIYHDVYGVEKSDTESSFTYCFTDGEMLDILNELLKSPVNKLDVQRLLLNGKK